MDGKVIVITGALGALGSVVANEALGRGARIASVDHAPLANWSNSYPQIGTVVEAGGATTTCNGNTPARLTVEAPEA